MAIHSLLRPSHAPKYRSSRFSRSRLHGQDARRSRHTVALSSAAERPTSHTVTFSSAAEKPTGSEPHSDEDIPSSDDGSLPLRVAPFLRLPTELAAEVLKEVFIHTTMHPLDRSDNFPNPPVLRTCQSVRKAGLKLWCEHLVQQWHFCRIFKMQELSGPSVLESHLLMEPTTWMRILDDRAANLWMLWTHALVSTGEMEFEVAMYRSPLFEWRF